MSYWNLIQQETVHYTVTEHPLFPPSTHINKGGYLMDLKSVYSFLPICDTTPKRFSSLKQKKKSHTQTKKPKNLRKGNKIFKL